MNPISLGQFRILEKPIYEKAQSMSRQSVDVECRTLIHAVLKDAIDPTIPRHDLYQTLDYARWHRGDNDPIRTLSVMARAHLDAAAERSNPRMTWYYIKETEDSLEELADEGQIFALRQLKALQDAKLSLVEPALHTVADLRFVSEAIEIADAVAEYVPEKADVAYRTLLTAAQTRPVSRESERYDLGLAIAEGARPDSATQLGGFALMHAYIVTLDNDIQANMLIQNLYGSELAPIRDFADYELSLLRERDNTRAGQTRQRVMEIVTSLEDGRDYSETAPETDARIGSALAGVLSPELANGENLKFRHMTLSELLSHTETGSDLNITILTAQAAVLQERKDVAEPAELVYDATTLLSGIGQVIEIKPVERTHVSLLDMGNLLLSKDYRQAWRQHTTPVSVEPSVPENPAHDSLAKIRAEVVTLAIETLIRHEATIEARRRIKAVATLAPFTDASSEAEQETFEALAVRTLKDHSDTKFDRSRYDTGLLIARRNEPESDRQAAGLSLIEPRLVRIGAAEIWYLNAKLAGLAEHPNLVEWSNRQRHELDKTTDSPLHHPITFLLNKLGVKPAEDSIAAASLKLRAELKQQQSSAPENTLVA